MNQRMIQAARDDIRQDSKRLEISQFLNSLLADEYLLSTKTKSYHWNVTGPHFYELHRLFGDQYAQIDQLIDQIGERVRALGANALGTMTEFLRCARLQEHPGVYPSEWTMADDLYDDHEVLVHSLRGALAGNESLHYAKYGPQYHSWRERGPPARKRVVNPLVMPLKGVFAIAVDTPNKSKIV